MCTCVCVETPYGERPSPQRLGLFNVNVIGKQLTSPDSAVVNRPSSVVRSILPDYCRNRSNTYRAIQRDVGQYLSSPWDDFGGGRPAIRRANANQLCAGNRVPYGPPAASLMPPVLAGRSFINKATSVGGLRVLVIDSRRLHDRWIDSVRRPTSMLRPVSAAARLPAAISASDTSTELDGRD